MPHILWVARQNKLEIPNDEEEVNTREIHKCEGQAHDPDTVPPRDGKGFTISGNLKSFLGPVLKCRGSRKHRAFDLNELVIHEIRNNASAIFQNFPFTSCKIEFVQL